jgi:hypothetical protein
MIGIKLNKFIFISFKLYKEIVFPNFKIILSIKNIGHPLKLLKSINKSIITFFVYCHSVWKVTLLSLPNEVYTSLHELRVD